MCLLGLRTLLSLLTSKVSALEPCSWTIIVNGKPHAREREHNKHQKCKFHIENHKQEAIGDLVFASYNILLLSTQPLRRVDPHNRQKNEHSTHANNSQRKSVHLQRTLIDL